MTERRFNGITPSPPCSIQNVGSGGAAAEKTLGGDEQAQFEKLAGRGIHAGGLPAGPAGPHVLHLVDQGISRITLNATQTGLKFFFDVTLDRRLLPDMPAL